MIDEGSTVAGEAEWWKLTIDRWVQSNGGCRVELQMVGSELQYGGWLVL